MTNEEVMNLLTSLNLHEGGMDNWVADNAWVKFANLVAAVERKEMLSTIDAIYDSEAPNYLYQEGYNHALDHMEQFIKARSNT